MTVEEESGLPRVTQPEETAATATTAATDVRMEEDDSPAATTPADPATPTTGTTTPAEPATDGNSSGDDTTTRCVICLDAVAEPCVAQPCGHRHFDFLCLVSWLLQHHPSCPLCKATVAAVQYGDDLAKTFPVPKEREKSPAEETLSAAEVQADAASASTTAPAPARRRRPRREPPPSSASPSPSAALEHRRRVYRLGLYARHVGANRHSRCYRELTPQLFAQDPDLVSRARAFLRRELQVFWGADGRAEMQAAAGSGSGSGSRRASNIEFLLEYIVAILQTIDLQGSGGQAEELLQGFLGRRDHTRQFLHELRSFLRSPYLTLASWDRHVQYGPPGTRLRGEDEEEEDEGEGEREEERERQAEDRKRYQQVRLLARGDYWRPPRYGGGANRARRDRRDGGDRGDGSSSSRSSRPLPLYRQR